MTELSKQYDFNYLIDKISNAIFSKEPFKHIYLEDFFSEEHFEEIINSHEISVICAKNDQELIDSLQQKGFEPIDFPGTVMNIDQYVAWHASRQSETYNLTCEGFGMTFRLKQVSSSVIKTLNTFLLSKDFSRAIADKFDIKYDKCYFDGGIQKYLDGYEISPHTDIRRKAATFMVNINPSEQSKNMDHHTHYLAFDDAHKYVQSFWKGNETVDRAWVPWNWAKTIKQQSKNNSIVLFSPSNDTLHGVKANYDHLIAQRTQLYGNLWYSENPANSRIEWEGLNLIPKPNPVAPAQQIERKKKGRKGPNLKSMIPSPVKSAIKRIMNLYRSG